MIFKYIIVTLEMTKECQAYLSQGKVTKPDMLIVQTPIWISCRAEMINKVNKCWYFFHVSVLGVSISQLYAAYIFHAVLLNNKIHLLQISWHRNIIGIIWNKFQFGSLSFCYFSWHWQSRSDILKMMDQIFLFIFHICLYEVWEILAHHSFSL